MWSVRQKDSQNTDSKRQVLLLRVYGTIYWEMHGQYFLAVFGCAAVQGGVLLYSQSTPWLLCNCTANPTNCSLTTDTSGKFSVCTVFGMGTAWEITLTTHCMCASTGFSFKVFIGLYIQKSSWKHTGIFLPPVTAEITYCHHPIYQQGNFCMFTFQILLNRSQILQPSDPPGSACLFWLL